VALPSIPFFAMTTVYEQLNLKSSFVFGSRTWTIFFVFLRVLWCLS